LIVGGVVWGFSLVWVLAFVVVFDENAAMKNNFSDDDDVLFEVARDVEPLVVRVPAGRSKVFRRYDRDQSLSTKRNGRGLMPCLDASRRSTTPEF
jgi:hypothetical protein